MDQSLSDFQNGIGTAPYANLGMKQLISCIGTVVVDTITSLQDFDGEVIPVSEVHDYDL